MGVRSTIVSCLALLLAGLSPAGGADEASTRAGVAPDPSPTSPTDTPGVPVTDPLAGAGSLRPLDPVLELFTSHGCSSCPRADRLLGELLERDPSLIGLEYHVDYWDDLVHGAAGNFVDPFSDAAWTLRQRRYERLPLAGRSGVYTPQAIVDGRHVAVGSDAARIERALGTGRDGTPRLSVERDGDALVVRVGGVTHGERDTRHRSFPVVPAPDTGEVVLVHFLRETRTPITGGENRGLELVNHRVVTRIESLGTVDASGALRVRAGAPIDPAHGCAVLVRHGNLEPRLGGRLCPDPA